jgi:hypothetical protein
MDRTAVVKRKLYDPQPESEWIHESPQRRLEALEFLRQNHSPTEYATGTIQRVYRVTRRKSG